MHVSGRYESAGWPVRISRADPSASHEALLAPCDTQSEEVTPSESQLGLRYLGAAAPPDVFGAGVVADG
jgi:hypothetical protein